MEVQKLTDNKIKDQSKLVTVSLDNTMRVWDPTDLSCLEVLKNPEKCEITTLFYLKKANLFVTGHEDGTVRMWNIELQTSITITQDGNPHAHSNSICAFTEYIHMRSLDDVT
jgi:WD40 repeat protein